jgi:hypothetical protein
MRLEKKKAKLVLASLVTLQAEGVISMETLNLIRSNIEPITFDWRKLARYSFIAAISCLVISVCSFIFDDLIIRWFEKVLPVLMRLFNAPPGVRSAGLATLSAFVFWLGLKQRSKYPNRIYSNEAVFFIGVIGIACSIYCLEKAIGVVDLRYLLAFASIIYCALGLWLESKVIWFYGLISFSATLGSSTGYEMGGYFIGMEYPTRSLVFGLVLIFLSEFMHSQHMIIISEHNTFFKRFLLFFGVTRVIGLLHLFISLWIMSIWGSWAYEAHSYSDFRWDCLVWSVLFGAVSIVTVAQALQKDDAVLRGFGLTFFFIGLYTKFFEYFWDGIHKAIIFGILGISFWVLGRWAESLLHINVAGVKKLINRNENHGA